MYYEEKIIDGCLYFRTMPNSNWRLSHSPIANAIAILCNQCTSEERKKVFSFFTEEGEVKND